jgi:hypothetical protein
MPDLHCWFQRDSRERVGIEWGKYSIHRLPETG